MPVSGDFHGPTTILSHGMSLYTTAWKTAAPAGSPRPGAGGPQKIQTGLTGDLPAGRLYPASKVESCHYNLPELGNVADMQQALAVWQDDRDEKGCLTWWSTLLAPPVPTQQSTMAIAMTKELVRPIFSVTTTMLQSQCSTFYDFWDNTTSLNLKIVNKLVNSRSVSGATARY